MIRKEAMEIIGNEIGDEPIISANGYISRDLFNVKDKPSNFYMIGSMGLASSIGLGVALKNSRKKIFVFDGDGNILMNLGSLITIGSLKPKNLIHIIFDNNVHESTGGQPTNSKNVEIGKIGQNSNYKVFQINSKLQLKREIKKIRNRTGPIMMIVKINSKKIISKRITHKPSNIREQFMKTLRKK